MVIWYAVYSINIKHLPQARYCRHWGYVSGLNEDPLQGACVLGEGTGARCITNTILSRGLDTRKGKKSMGRNDNDWVLGELCSQRRHL